MTTNITEGYPDFKTLERIAFKTVCGTACKLIQEHLESLDQILMATRDTNEYRLVNKRTTTIKTLMGEVTFERRYYRESSGRDTFLLDKALGLNSGCGLVSENLAEQIVDECSEKSFRKAAYGISLHTGQYISAQGAWNVIQQYGGKIECQETRLQELDDRGSTGHLGNIVSSVLFDELDDVWVSRQKEKRQKKGKDSAIDTPVVPVKKTGKKPIHMGTAYTGWIQKKDGRYATINKIAYASCGDVFSFTSMFETILRHRFDMDRIEQRITNGDGAAWIKAATEANDSILQLDPYHRSKAILREVGNRVDRQLLFDTIAEKDVRKVLSIILTLSVEAQDDGTKKKLKKLYDYFNNNKDSFLTWQERGIELPAPPEKVLYRNLGVQESTNCTLVTQRMKHRRGSWSDKGAEHMAKILCLRNTIGIDTILGTLPEVPIVKQWPDPLSAAKTPRIDGKGYGADWLHAEMPFEHAFRTNGREAIRNMLKQQTLPWLSGNRQGW